MSRRLFPSDSPLGSKSQKLTDYKAEAKLSSEHFEVTKKYAAELWNRVWTLQNNLNTIMQTQNTRKLEPYEEKTKAVLSERLERVSAILKRTDYEKLIEEREKQAEVANSKLSLNAG